LPPQTHEWCESMLRILGYDQLPIDTSLRTASGEHPLYHEVYLKLRHEVISWNRQENQNFLLETEKKKKN
jgi:hypothetical protein